MLEPERERRRDKVAAPAAPPEDKIPIERVAFLSRYSRQLKELIRELGKEKKIKNTYWYMYKTSHSGV